MGSLAAATASASARSAQNCRNMWKSASPPESVASHDATDSGGDADFHMFLQFCADRALADAVAAAKLPIGLYRDLAVGPAPDGAELATGREWFAANVSV